MSICSHGKSCSILKFELKVYKLCKTTNFFEHVSRYFLKPQLTIAEVCSLVMISYFNIKKCCIFIVFFLITVQGQSSSYQQTVLLNLLIKSNTKMPEKHLSANFMNVDIPPCTINCFLRSKSSVNCVNFDPCISENMMNKHLPT